LSFILLSIILLSNITTPVSYAAETVVASSSSNSTPVNHSLPPAPRSKFHQPASGSVLGASTSLFEIGTQSLGEEQGTVGSANKNMPIRMQALAKKVYQTNENVT